jgi:hypothetical protein
MATLQSIAGSDVELRLGPDTKHRKTPLLFVEPGFVAVLNQLRIAEDGETKKD